ncbi:MAG: YggS family pyridoxal phosphate-dependent enzyme [Ruminococcaceae bacterium]|nr:YggS family pyridoxal phosphate-dependent enzyme [Oscillospiraceae bacterium]
MEGKFSKETVLEKIVEVKQKIRNAAELSGRNFNDVTILAATKTVDADTINFAIENGISCIGENRVQELIEKYDSINKENVAVHFIGRLQTNKVKYICDKVSMIHSVDSVKLAREIDKQCAKIDKVMDVLVEVNIAGEESKGGIEPENLEEFLVEISRFSNIRVVGLMCIPPVCRNDAAINENGGFTSKSEENISSTKKSYKNNEFFEKIMKLFLDISQKKLDNIYMQELSMGMSDDFEQAVLQGSTIVRIGRGLFGSR